MEPFWKTKSLEQMSLQEWESLCDGCGRCCLHKLRHEESNELSFTNIACRLLDLDSCKCSDYSHRQRRVPDCVGLTPAALTEIDWLPPSCGYRRIRDGKDLAWWHPLVSGDPDTVHQAGVSVRGRAISERRAGALEDHVVDWPGKAPRIRHPKTRGMFRRPSSHPDDEIPKAEKLQSANLSPKVGEICKTGEIPRSGETPEADDVQSGNQIRSCGAAPGNDN